MPKGNLEHDTTTNAPAGDQLRSIIERVERLTEEKRSIADDIKDVFAESKGHGFDNKIVRIILKRRAMEAAARAEQDALVHLYSGAIGMKSPADAEADE
ncbi:MAG: DUF2312 domain-containing protein [Gemmatimonadales bacterium]|nr:DUF2312 domain-containing protein [Gemmatimonadales bacterium]